MGYYLAYILRFINEGSEFVHSDAEEHLFGNTDLGKAVYKKMILKIFC